MGLTGASCAGRAAPPAYIAVSCLVLLFPLQQVQMTGRPLIKLKKKKKKKKKKKNNNNNKNNNKIIIK